MKEVNEILKFFLSVILVFIISSTITPLNYFAGYIILFFSIITYIHWKPYDSHIERSITRILTLGLIIIFLILDYLGYDIIFDEMLIFFVLPILIGAVFPLGLALPVWFIIYLHHIASFNEYFYQLPILGLDEILGVILSLTLIILTYFVSFLIRRISGQE